MDWGIDPERVADITEIVRNRRFSAADSEKFMLAIVGGAGEHADSMLWEMNQILLGLGLLLATPRMPPRDAAIAGLLDETGVLLAPLRRGKSLTVPLGVVMVDATGLTLGNGAAARTFGWSRIRRAMGMADFLFMSPQVEPAVGSGAEALRQALDALFCDGHDLIAVSKRAVQAPARYMRSWRKRYLPLQAFADLVRYREAFLTNLGRSRSGRSLDADDVFGLWSFAVEQGETWSFGRFVEKLAALLREERTDTERRAFLAPISIDAMVSGEPQDNPENQIIAWLDRDTDLSMTGDTTDDLAEPDEATDEDQTFTERSLAALNALPHSPKVLTKEERREAALALALIPVAHEQPITLQRTMSVTPWENRLVEATRRGLADSKGGGFDYVANIRNLESLDCQLSDLVLVAAYLEAPALASEGAKVLKKWRHDRASFRIEDAELAQTFARMSQDLRVVATSLKRILLQQGRLARDSDLKALEMRDEACFASIFGKRYGKTAEKTE